MLLGAVYLFVNGGEKIGVEGLLDFLSAQFPRITSLFYVINSKKNDSLSDQEPVLYKGNDHLIEEVGGLRFRIGPKSFAQTNTKQADELYRIGKEFASFSGDEVVYDLYTGTGTIANFVASQAKTVIGIEFVEDAITDAKENSKTNNINNTLFFAGDMKDVLTADFIARHGKPDVIITDPPRAGMHEDVTNMLLKAAPKRIVYVSCNAATQARDLKILSEQYDITAVQPVDMFPQTIHVENVARLDLKK